MLSAVIITHNAKDTIGRCIDALLQVTDDVVIVDGKSLQIPHPRLTGRSFVLNPLLQIAPDLVHPRLNKTIRQLCEELSNETHSELRDA